VFLDGVLISGPITGTLDRSIELDLNDEFTGMPEVQDAEDQPISIWALANYRPDVNWKQSVNAYKYRIEIDDATEFTRWPTGEVRMSAPVGRKLEDGWHKFVVVGIDENLDEIDSQEYWYHVYAPGDPVSGITVSAGSGPGLYDITLP